MKIYSDLDLCSNILSNVRIGNYDGNLTPGLGSIKVGANGVIFYYDTGKGEWSALGGGGDNIYVDGLFYLKANTADGVTTSTNSDVNIGINVTSSGGGYIKVATDSNNNGQINIIGATSSSSEETSINIPVTNLVSSNIVKTGSFTVSPTTKPTWVNGNQMEINVIVSSGISSPNLSLHLYKKSSQAGQADKYEQVLCDYEVGTSGSITLKLIGLSDGTDPANLNTIPSNQITSNIWGDYIFIIVGSTGAGILTTGNSISITSRQGTQS